MTAPTPEPDWENFYRDYRKPGFIPGYEILNKLGGGVFGIVYKARKESIGKDYAIKFLKLDQDGVRSAVEKELESVHLFAQVDHPNLVTIEDRGEVHGIPFLIMGYAGEDTLRSRLDAGRLSRDTALRVFAQVARGVQALHDHSLVHFDLKPANVFMRGDIARLGDYGLSKLVSTANNSLSFGRGTPYYMAPELLHRHGDSRSDIYSLGVMLFESLSGEVPFRGDSEWEVLRKHEREEPNYPAVIEPRERQVISRCLQKDPDARYQSVQELLGELFAGGAPVAGDLGHDVLPSSVPMPPPMPLPMPMPPPQPTAEAHSAIQIPPAPRKRRGMGHGMLLFLMVMLFPLLAIALYTSRKGSRARVQTMAVEIPGPLTSSEARLHLSPRSSPTVIRLVEDTYDRLRRKQITPGDARLRLKPFGIRAIVFGANELLSLNYLDRRDTAYCQSLHQVLGLLTGFSFRFHIPKRPTGPVSTGVGRRNRMTTEQFRAFVLRTMAR